MAEGRKTREPEGEGKDVERRGRRGRRAGLRLRGRLIDGEKQMVQMRNRRTEAKRNVEGRRARKGGLLLYLPRGI